MKKNLIISLVSLLLISCSTVDSTAEKIDVEKKENYYPINYRTEIPNNYFDDLGEIDYSYYKQSRRRLKEFQDGNNQNLKQEKFVDDRTELLVKELKSDTNIVDANVVQIDNRLVVAVILNDYGERDVADKIEQKVSEIVDDKEIIVFTDYTYWEQVKDARSSKGASRLGNKADDFLENFFNLEMKR